MAAITMGGRRSPLGEEKPAGSTAFNSAYDHLPAPDHKGSKTSVPGGSAFGVSGICETRISRVNGAGTS